MKYGIFYDDQEKSEVVRVEVDAPELATALFLAGMQVAQNGDPIGPLQVVQAETVEWKEVRLP
jgi:hypothetical protein